MLFAVHISDGVLAGPWLVAGFALAALLVWMGAWRLREEEVPRIALLTAAFFVSSLIHIKVPPTSIHLLLSGLIGVVLGPRAALAIFVGLLLQVLLMQHGGYYTLGVNTCVMTLPALLAYLLFQSVHRLESFKTSIGRGLLVGLGAFVWILCGVYSLTLLVNATLRSLEFSAIELANARLLNPWILLAALVVAALAILVERRLENTPEFPVGFLIGLLSVLATAGLNCVVLILGGERHWPVAPLVLVVAHMPFAVIEGVILGIVVGFLARVKPEMLGVVQSASIQAVIHTPDRNADSPGIVCEVSNPGCPSDRG